MSEYKHVTSLTVKITSILVVRTESQKSRKVTRNIALPGNFGTSDNKRKYLREFKSYLPVLNAVQ